MVYLSKDKMNKRSLGLRIKNLVLDSFLYILLRKKVRGRVNSLHSRTSFCFKRRDKIKFVLFLFLCPLVVCSSNRMPPSLMSRGSDKNSFLVSCFTCFSPSSFHPLHQHELMHNNTCYSLGISFLFIPSHIVRE